MPYANNKGTDQPAHLCSLISTFVVCCLDSLMSLFAIDENFKTLASLCSCRGRFESYLVENPEDRFFRDKAHFKPKQSVGEAKLKFSKRTLLDTPNQNLPSSCGLYQHNSSKENSVMSALTNVGWLCWCFTALQHILGNFGQSQLT